MHPILLPLLFLLAPSSAASNLTNAMSSKGCKSFANLLLSTADAASTFASNAGSGLTVFCPSDQALQSFSPKFKNLSADDKLSLLLFHAVPVYYPFSMLNANNGPMNTLATDGAVSSFNFTVQNDGQTITLKTKASPDVSTVVSTVYDRDPVAVYKIDRVLEPVELFKPDTAPAPAPEARDVEADAPAKAKGKGKGKKKAMAPAADSPGKEPEDQTAADESGAGERGFGGLVVAPVMVAVAGVLLL